MKDIFNKRQRFSIRKFSVGVASVLIGIALFTPSQGVLASTENSLPSVEKREAVQPISDNQNNPSSELDTRDVPIGSTRTTETVTSGDKENNSLTTRDFVAGEDRSSTPAVRAASNTSEVKKYELTDEYAKQIKAGVIGSEGNKLDSLLLNGPELSPEAYTDNDYLKDKEELYIYEKGGKKYVGYNSHPLLEDTDGDGIIDSKEKPDEKLKWNVSERDMIMFMELSYRDDNYIDRVLDHKKPLTESELYKKNGDRRPRYEYMMMNKELGPYWERKKSYHTSSGLDAVLYETKSDFLYLPNGTAQVLAFRGTSDVKDIKADITLGTGGNPQQGIDAENIMRELAKDKSITNLYLTGHSLGGYLVQRAMVEAYQLAYSDSRVMSTKEQLAYRNFYNNVLKKGTTFNAPKVVTSLVSKREFWQKGLDSKKIAKSGKLTHYIVDNDSTIRKGVSNDSDVVINVGPTSGGHSSRSYFEADMINRRSEFISGKRISLDGTGYQDKKITTIKSVEKVGETAVYSKRGDDIIKSTTVSMKNPDTGQITKNTLDEVFKKDGVKDKVEVETIPSPVKYEKDASREKGQDNITIPGKDGSKTTTTTYTVNPNSGEAIAHVGEPVIVNPTETIVKVAAKDKVVETLIEPAVVYEKDDTRDFGTPDEPREGAKGKSVTTTRYDVNPNNGTVTEHVGKPVVTPAGKTIVKVGAKTKVERSKDEQGREVINTTTYEVDPKTGKVTPTIVRTYGKTKEPTVEKRVVPSPVVYEKDGTKEKGIEAITVKGEEGEDTITTTYRVNPTTGEITPIVGKPVRTKEPTNTIVKIPAKDKVVYSKDGDNVVKTVTTYRVEPNTGNITEDISVLISNEHILESAKLDIAALLITKWVDEDGHDLKPADVKEPATLGGANEALEAGEIEEYVFLRTEKDEEKHVVKHIFKKVSSNRLIGINNHETSNHETSNHETSNHETSNHETSNHETSNHETSNHETSNHESSNHESSNQESSNQESSNQESSNQESSNKESSNHESNNYESNNPQPMQSDDTERESEKVTLNEQVGEVVNNALTKSNDSQNVLPSTGTESNATLASLGLLGMLSGLGLALGKKKED